MLTPAWFQLVGIGARNHEGRVPNRVQDFVNGSELLRGLGDLSYLRIRAWKGPSSVAC